MKYSKINKQAPRQSADLKLKNLKESKLTLEDPKADKPEKTGEMPSKYELSWSEFDDAGAIVDKDKNFDSLEKFEEFRSKLELNPKFLQIYKQTKPSTLDAMPGAKSEEMEKVKLKESAALNAERKIRRLLEVAVRRELTAMIKSSRAKKR